jgi:hypothetical protein
MTKFIRVIENPKEEPKNKQAKELLDYARKVHGNKKFDQKDFVKLLSEQRGKETALKNSKADPALTWNYYRPALWFYGSIEMYEDDTKLTPKLGSIDPYNRTKKSANKSLSLTDELKMLEERVEKDMERMEEINDLLKKAAEANADSSNAGTDTTSAGEDTASGANTTNSGTEDKVAGTEGEIPEEVTELPDEEEDENAEEVANA